MSNAPGAGTRDRLDGIPSGIIRLAARRLPPRVQDDLREEWIAELAEILHGSSAPAASRLLRGLHFAIGLLMGASRISRALGGTVPEASRPSGSQAPVRSHTAVARVGFAETAVSELDYFRWVYQTMDVHVPPLRQRPGPRV